MQRGNFQTFVYGPRLGDPSTFGADDFYWHVCA